ncbi:hypothetical protein [Sinorhizobium medicae]
MGDCEGGHSRDCRGNSSDIGREICTFSLMTVGRSGDDASGIVWALLEFFDSYLRRSLPHVRPSQNIACVFGYLFDDATQFGTAAAADGPHNRHAELRASAFCLCRIPCHAAARYGKAVLGEDTTLTEFISVSMNQRQIR